MKWIYDSKKLSTSNNKMSANECFMVFEQLPLKNSKDKTCIFYFSCGTQNNCVKRKK